MGAPKRVVFHWESDGWFVTETWYTMQLLRTHNAEKPVDLLWIDAVGQSQSPALEWATPKKLQITVPNISSIKLEHAEFNGAQVDLRFDPPDQAARKLGWRSISRFIMDHSAH